MPVFKDESEVYQFIGGIFVEALADPDIGPKFADSGVILKVTEIPIRVWSEDPLERDMFFRFNGSLQEFVNAIVLEECIDCGFCVPMCPVDCIRDARQAGLDGETESGWHRIRELQAWAHART